MERLPCDEAGAIEDHEERIKSFVRAWLQYRKQLFASSGSQEIDLEGPNMEDSRIYSTMVDMYPLDVSQIVAKAARAFFMVWWNQMMGHRRKACQGAEAYLQAGSDHTLVGQQHMLPFNNIDRFQGRSKDINGKGSTVYRGSSGRPRTLSGRAGHAESEATTPTLDGSRPGSGGSSPTAAKVGAHGETGTGSSSKDGASGFGSGNLLVGARPTLGPSGPGAGPHGLSAESGMTREGGPLGRGGRTAARVLAGSAAGAARVLAGGASGAVANSVVASSYGAEGGCIGPFGELTMPRGVRKRDIFFGGNVIRMFPRYTSRSTFVALSRRSPRTPTLSSQLEFHVRTKVDISVLSGTLSSHREASARQKFIDRIRSEVVSSKRGRWVWCLSSACGIQQPHKRVADVGAFVADFAHMSWSDRESEQEKDGGSGGNVNDGDNGEGGVSRDGSAESDSIQRSNAVSEEYDRSSDSDVSSLSDDSPGLFPSCAVVPFVSDIDAQARDLFSWREDLHNAFGCASRFLPEYVRVYCEDVRLQDMERLIAEDQARQITAQHVADVTTTTGAEERGHDVSATEQGRNSDGREPSTSSSSGDGQRRGAEVDMMTSAKHMIAASIETDGIYAVSEMGEEWSGWREREHPHQCLLGSPTFDRIDALKRYMRWRDPSFVGDVHTATPAAVQTIQKYLHTMRQE